MTRQIRRDTTLIPPFSPFCIVVRDWDKMSQRWTVIMKCIASSFTLNSMVNAANKHQGSSKTDCSENKKEAIAHDSIIAKKEN